MLQPSSSVVSSLRSDTPCVPWTEPEETSRDAETLQGGPGER
jgi:hypothetical protein